LTTGEPEAGQGDDDDERDGDGCGGARHRADLFAGDLRQRAATPARRGPEHDEVVDRAGQADPADQPDQARRPAELRRQHRTDERAGAR
jgi:hypothetical protein